LIKAIVFDLDGVYFPNGVKDFIKNVSEIYKCQFTNVKEAYSGKEARAYWANKLSKEEYWDFFVKKLNIHATPDELIKLFLDGYSVDEKIAELVRIVRNKFKTIIFTNNFKDRFEGLKKKYDFIKDFDVIITSYEIGEAKPHEKMFKELLEKTRCKPQEILVIDDSESNLKGVAEKGYETVLYKNYEQLIEKLKKRGIL